MEIWIVEHTKFSFQNILKRKFSTQKYLINWRLWPKNRRDYISATKPHDLCKSLGVVSKVGWENMYQGLRWHGFEGFDQTRQLLGISNENYIFCHFTGLNSDNLPLLRRFGARHFKIPTKPLCIHHTDSQSS